MKTEPQEVIHLRGKKRHSKNNREIQTNNWKEQ